MNGPLAAYRQAQDGSLVNGFRDRTVTRLMNLILRFGSRELRDLISATTRAGLRSLIARECRNPPFPEPLDDDD